MKDPIYKVPDNKQVRVIIDTDAYAEGDDQYAIAHALMTPKFDIAGIVAEHFGKRRNIDNAMEKSHEEIVRILNHMDCTEIPALRGEIDPLADKKEKRSSEGVDFIIREAIKEDERPLFILNMGAVTNLAAAYLKNPEIAQRDIAAIWIGGGPYDGAMMDFNAGNDLVAANVLMESDIELWQIPLTAYIQMEVSFHELYDRVKPYGAIGEYLFSNLLRVSDRECSMNFDDFFGKNASKAAKTMIIRSGEGWSLGDSPAVGVLVTGQEKHKKFVERRKINPDGSYGEIVNHSKNVRVYESIDSRVILEDFFAKIKYNFS